MNKDTVFSIRISSENLDEIRRRAKQARMSQSDYVVRCCLGKPVVVIDALREFLSELRAIGNNLNQIARYFNMGGLHSIAIRQEINECVMELMKMRKAVMDMAGDFHGGTQTPVE